MRPGPSPPARTQAGERQVRPWGRREVPGWLRVRVVDDGSSLGAPGGRASPRTGEWWNGRGDPNAAQGRTGSSPAARSMSVAEDASLSVVAIPAELPSSGPSGAWYRADSGSAGAGARRIRLARCELSSLKSTSARTM